MRKNPPDNDEKIPITGDGKSIKEEEMIFQKLTGNTVRLAGVHLVGRTTFPLRRT